MSAKTLTQLSEVATKNIANDICHMIVQGLDNPRPSGTMRDWFYGKGGLGVTTVQVNGMGVWAPTGRTVSTKAKTYVTLDGSRRDYAGLKVIHADERVLIVDGKHETIAYYAEY